MAVGSDRYFFRFHASGATLAFLVARFLLRDWVQDRYAETGSASQSTREWRKDGAFYLFTLRMIPVFPFWLINLLMGLTRIPAWLFYVVSQLGMLPATVIYVNAGSQLAQIDSLQRDSLSPAVLDRRCRCSGIFPLVAKKADRIRGARRKVYRGL